MKTNKNLRKFVFCITMFVILAAIGCMSTRSAEKHQTATPFVKSQFNGKSVAILPTSETKTSIATESNRSLKLAVNESLDIKVSALIPNAKIIKHKMTAMTLNDSNKLSLLEDLFKTYEVTGTYDNKTITGLCECLHADYIVVSKITAGKLDAILTKASTITLDVSIVNNQSKQVVWGGSGLYRKGGIMGFGGIDDKEVAEELVKLAFSNYE